MKKTFLNRIAAVVLTLALLLCVTCVQSFAAADYRDNIRFVPVTASQATDMYNTGEKFILFGYRNDCENCQYIGNNIVTIWMNTYKETVYGINMDSAEGLPNWVWKSLDVNNATLPVVAFVQHGSADVFSCPTNLVQYNDSLSRWYYVFRNAPKPVTDPALRILPPEETAIAYGTSVKLFAEIINPPEGCRVEWNYTIAGTTTRTYHKEGMCITITASGDSQVVAVNAVLMDSSDHPITVDGKIVSATQNIEFRNDFQYRLLYWAMVLWNIIKKWFKVFIGALS